MARVSVVIPVYHNAASLESLHERFEAVARRNAGDDFEFLYVDDGSTDHSLAVLAQLALNDPRVRVVKLSRNFGSNAAIRAGFCHATGEAVVAISADLQDPPELIDEMLAHWRRGRKVVLAARRLRDDPTLTSLASDLFYRLFRAIANRSMPKRGFDVFLVDRQVRDLVRSSKENNLYLTGLILSFGFDPKVVQYDRRSRDARFGRSQWTLSKKANHFIDSIVGFSYVPLRLALVLGLLVSAIGMVYALVIVAMRFAYGAPVPGWTSLMAGQMVLAGVELFVLGVFGEYLWRALDQSRGRPPFIVDEVIEGARRSLPVMASSPSAPSDGLVLVHQEVETLSCADLGGRANDVFEGSHVLITGGLGFLGSTLAIRLVQLGARVTLADAMIPEYGGNLFNIAPIADSVNVNFCDICDRHAMNWLVRGKDFVFHLAGQVSHVMSFCDPFPDIEYNIKGTAVLMEAIRACNPGARVVFTGTRGQYGPATRLPVGEMAPTNPKGIYEISNLTAEKILQVYNDAHGVASVMLRLTNIYGPRAQMKHSQYGVLNWFVRLVLDGQTIPIFGDGRIKRDFLYVEDCVDAIVACAVDTSTYGEILNVGDDRATDFLEAAEILVRLSGDGRWEFAPFTPERRAQEPGDFCSDISKIQSLVGWRPRTPLEEGLRATLDYYRRHRSHYWTSAESVERKAA